MSRTKKGFLVFLLGIVLLTGFALSCSAQGEDYYAQQKQASGADALPKALPEDTQALLEELGIDDVDFYSIFETSPRRVLSSLLGILQGELAAPLKGLLRIIGILLLLSIAQSFVPNDEKLQQTVLFVGSALALVSILGSLSALISAAASAIAASAQFMLVLVPVLVAVIAVSGNPTLAVSYQSLVFAAAQGIAQMGSSIVVPVTGMFLAGGVVCAMAPDFQLSQIIQTIKKVAYGCISIAASLFAGLLSLKGVMANAADTLATRGIKLLLKTAVPVVGGALSEAYASIAGSLTLLRTAVGAFGIVALVLLNAPILLQITLWVLCMHLCGACAGMLALESMQELFATIASALTLLGVVLLFTAVLLVLCVGLTLAIRVDQ